MCVASCTLLPAARLLSPTAAMLVLATSLLWLEVPRLPTCGSRLSVVVLMAQLVVAGASLNVALLVPSPRLCALDHVPRLVVVTVVVVGVGQCAAMSWRHVSVVMVVPLVVGCVVGPLVAGVLSTVVMMAATPVTEQARCRGTRAGAEVRIDIVDSYSRANASS